MSEKKKKQPFFDLRGYSLNITDLPAGHFYFCSCINGVDLTVSKIFERINIVSNSLKNRKYGSKTQDC